MVVTAGDVAGRVPELGGTFTGVLVLDLWTLDTTGVTSRATDRITGGDDDLERLPDEVLLSADGLLDRVLLRDLLLDRVGVRVRLLERDGPALASGGGDPARDVLLLDTIRIRRWLGVLLVTFFLDFAHSAALSMSLVS